MSAGRGNDFKTMSVSTWGGIEPRDASTIADVVMYRDTAAFARADWDAVAGDFDPARFVGYSGADAPTWRVAFPTLESYRDKWVGEARGLREFADAPEIERQILACCRIAAVDLQGDHAIVHKVFDGELRLGAHVVPQRWQTYYFLRRDRDAWLITGFVGYLPGSCP